MKQVTWVFFIGLQRCTNGHGHIATFHFQQWRKAPGLHLGRPTDLLWATWTASSTHCVDGLVIKCQRQKPLGLGGPHYLRFRDTCKKRITVSAHLRKRNVATARLRRVNMFGASREKHRYKTLSLKPSSSEHETILACVDCTNDCHAWIAYDIQT